MASSDTRFTGAGFWRFAVPAMLVASSGATAEQDAIEACREASTDAARIACLENALRRQENPGEAAPPAEPVAPEAPEPVADGAPESETAEAPQPAALEGTESAAPPASPRAATQATAPVPKTAAADIGAEQVRARNESREERDARLDSAHRLKVAAYTTVPYRRLQVELENGQIWRQVKGDTQRIRVDLERNQTVDINETGLGGYKLRLNEIRRIIAVERVR